MLILKRSTNQKDIYKHKTNNRAPKHLEYIDGTEGRRQLENSN